MRAFAVLPSCVALGAGTELVDTDQMTRDFSWRLQELTLKDGFKPERESKRAPVCV
ncbi:hypothetical protein Srot_2750 [Segniliparus rotundus DSM 44985]|uniref:Uncharacterized protein n=1 Tax=Segniliparus rotundus (strain ATCC BAA-972 / CDC 1076 / CIP 108378 / DSM 44985 / JCM 13578) TaxID=640132 RepID=D6ZCZ7_SEGRD|nr:hypothetical protein Srot_2750 [Segniliparus rotundus DSM 44985]